MLDRLKAIVAEASVPVAPPISLYPWWPRRQRRAAITSTEPPTANSGVQLLRRSMLGLLDTALPPDERRVIQAILDRDARERGVQFHALRTRESGSRRFMSVHVLVPGDWPVRRGHDMLEAVERDIRAAVPGSTVFTHLEAVDDPVSWEDTTLDRDDVPALADQDQ